MLQCPHDRTVLVERPYGDAIVQRCTRCTGLWLPPRVVAAAVGHVPDTSRARGAKPHPTRRCPDDSQPLIAIHAHGVEIDVCRRCGGVWLDDGELDRIVALRSRSGTATDVLDGAVHTLDAANAGGSVGDVVGDVFGAVFEFVGSALSGL